MKPGKIKASIMDLKEAFEPLTIQYFFVTVLYYMVSNGFHQISLIYFSITKYLAFLALFLEHIWLSASYLFDLFLLFFKMAIQKDIFCRNIQNAQYSFIVFDVNAFKK